MDFQKSIVRCLGILTISILVNSCSKDEKFLGQTSFVTTVQIRAFTTSNNPSFRIAIDDTSWNNIQPGSQGILQTLLTHSFTLPENGKSHISIKWKNNTVITDTNIVLKAINTYYLIQFDENKPPEFYTSFGEDVTSPPSEKKVKLRIFFKRDTVDASPFPSGVTIRFYKLVGSSSSFTQTPDTSVELKEGQVTSFIELPDCFYKENNQSVFMGYELVDTQTGDVLQQFCPQFNYGIIECSSNIGGLYQTMSFDYYEPIPGVPGCNFGSPEEQYKLKLLFGSN